MSLSKLHKNLFQKELKSFFCSLSEYDSFKWLLLKPRPAALSSKQKWKGADSLLDNAILLNCGCWLCFQTPVIAGNRGAWCFPFRWNLCFSSNGANLLCLLYSAAQENSVAHVCQCTCEIVCVFLWDSTRRRVYWCTSTYLFVWKWWDSPVIVSLITCHIFYFLGFSLRRCCINVFPFFPFSVCVSACVPFIDLRLSVILPWACRSDFGSLCA